MLTELAGDRDGAVDWAAIAVVLQGATTQYWLLTYLFGQHPTGVDEDRFVRAVTRLTAALIANSAGAQPHCDAAIAESPDTQVKETR